MPDARNLARELGRDDAVISPLIEIRVSGPLPPLGSGLVFGSANGVAAYAALGGPVGMAVWCVGARTARAAGAVGLSVHGVALDARRMVRLSFDRAPLVHLHGTHETGNIARRLSARGWQCASAAIYDQVACPLSAEAIALLCAGERVVVPLFSPRSAALFAARCPGAAWPCIDVIAISAAVARQVPRLVRSVHIAACPTAEAMRTATARVLMA